MTRLRCHCGCGVLVKSGRTFAARSCWLRTVSAEQRSAWGRKGAEARCGTQRFEMTVLAYHRFITRRLDRHE